ncbi:hypothetical protein [Streptomyces laurentii]|uniref:hypothetical protein n=1 Tax=Streptomyces laurentii TaxID=39478 RepID=UPI0033F6408C
MTVSPPPASTRLPRRRSVSPRPLLHTPNGLAYTDEHAEDRSIEGVLLGVVGERSESQRFAMERLLCRVCAEPAERSRDGMLWLLPLPSDTPDQRRREDWPEGVMAIEPPVCGEHARAAPPFWEGGYQVFYAAEAELVGVYGTLHPAPGVLADPVERILRFDDPRMPWMVATQFVRQLRRLTPAAPDQRR